MVLNSGTLPLSNVHHIHVYTVYSSYCGIKTTAIKNSQLTFTKWQVRIKKNIF